MVLPPAVLPPPRYGCARLCARSINAAFDKDLENTLKTIEERRSFTLASITKMEEEQQEKASIDDGAEEAARGAIKLNAAERKAAEAARVEHQRYLKQLELEERDCRTALKPIAGRDECISIIRSELTK